MKDKLKVGQPLFLVQSNHRGVSHEPKEVMVAIVGKKYFTLCGDTRRKFYIDTLKVVSEYSDNTMCYLTMNEILAERECNELSERIRKAFGSYGKLKYSLKQLRQINAIINEPL